MRGSNNYFYNFTHEYKQDETIHLQPERIELC